MRRFLIAGFVLAVPLTVLGAIGATDKGIPWIAVPLKASQESAACGPYDRLAYSKTAGNLLRCQDGGWATFNGGAVQSFTSDFQCDGGYCGLTPTVSATTKPTLASFQPIVTVDANGRVTSLTQQAIAIAASQIDSGAVGTFYGGTGTASPISTCNLDGAGSAACTSPDNGFTGCSCFVNSITAATPGTPVSYSCSVSGGSAIVTSSLANDTATVRILKICAVP